MRLFNIASTDGQYEFKAESPGQTKFTFQSNNRFADTQGYLRKKQEGAYRIQAETKIQVTRETYENTIAPLIIYPDDVIIKFERFIPTRGTATGRFVFEKADFTQAFDSKDDNAYGEMNIVATEIIRTA